MTAAVRTTTAMAYGAVYRTGRHASLNLCLSQPAWSTRWREENLIVHSRKFEAELALDVLYYWSYWQTRSIARPLCDSRATCQSVHRRHQSRLFPFLSSENKWLVQ